MTQAGQTLWRSIKNLEDRLTQKLAPIKGVKVADVDDRIQIYRVQNDPTEIDEVEYYRIKGFTIPNAVEVYALRTANNDLIVLGEVQKTALANYDLNGSLTVQNDITMGASGTLTGQRTDTLYVDTSILTVGALSGTNGGSVVTNATGVVARIQQLTNFTPPGPGIVNNTNVTALATGQTGAHLIGTVPHDAAGLVVEFSVTTAYVTQTWAEIALATAPTATSGNLTLLGSAVTLVGVANSTGLKTVTITQALTAGSILYVLMGSAAATPFQVRATLADELSTGVVRLATARPSTMGAPTAFSSSAVVTGALGLTCRYI